MPGSLRDPFTTGINSTMLNGPWEIWMKFWTCNFQTDFNDWWLRHHLWNCTNMNVTGLHWPSFNIGSGNGLVPSGNKPLPEPMLAMTQISCCHMASLGHNELSLIPAWISNHMPSKVCDRITYPFPNFNSCTIEVLEWMNNFIPHISVDPCFWIKKNSNAVFPNGFHATSAKLYW